MTLKLSSDEIKYIALFENMTGAVTKDCIINEGENKIIFVVKTGDIGIAIGKKGSNIQRVNRSIGKKIEVVEYSGDPAEFVKNIFQPYRVKKVSITDKEGKKLAKVEVDVRDKAQAIGGKGRNLHKARILADRHHNIDIMVV